VKKLAEYDPRGGYKKRTARRVLIMQRLNERDLTGYLIAEQTGWDQLVLPMRYEPRRYFYGFDVPPPPGMIPERELEDAASPQPVEAPRLKLHDPNTSPDKFNLPAAERSDTRPRAPKRLDLVGQFLDSLKKLEPGAPAADPEPGTKADRPVEAKVEAVAGAVPTPPPPAEERKPPRDCIRPTKLQWKNPKLLDGPAGSGRQDEGDLLWGKRFPLEQVEKAEEELGPDAPGQYGQRPTGEAGDIFKEETFRRYEPVWDTDEDKETGALRTYFGRVRLYGPTDGEVREFRASHCTWFQTVDTALTESRRSAFTAILTFGVTPEYDLLLWHVFRGRLNVQYQYPLIKAMKLGPVHWLQKQHKMIPAGAWPFKIAVQAVEAKASGLGIIQEAASDGNPLHPLKADTDKVTRAVPVAGMYGAGKVYHPYAGPRWLTDMEEELKQFPNGAYKDISDCVAHAGQMVVHDKIIRALCHGRAMAYTDADEVLPPDNVTEVDVNGAKVRVEWPEDGGPRNPPGGFGGYKNLFDGFFGGGGGGDNG
jgi:predicted phage terminase large subunit-like protein